MNVSKGNMTLNIDGKTRLVGLVGNNIGYTQSPLIHNFSIGHLGLNHVYVPFDLKQDHIAAFLDFFWQIGGIGFNVTTPYKEIVAKLIPNHNLKSVNTVYRGDLGWSVVSTDGEGFIAAARRLSADFDRFRRFVFLGNGGVVRAILKTLGQYCSNPEVFVLRRNEQRDDLLRSDLPIGLSISFRDFNPRELSKIVSGSGGETLVVQASSAPHQGDDLSRFVPALADYKGALIDLVYGADSALFLAAKKIGNPCQNGLPMLIEQARIAQHCWWGKSADYLAIAEILSLTC